MSQKLQKLRKQLKSRYLNRSNEIDGLLVALLAREHVLLLGPPGTAKSALIQDLCAAIEGANHFRRLLTRTTVAEEVLGVVPAKTLLEQEDYIRKTTGKLPEAHIGFLDEIYKANSTVLNALLTISNERLFDNPHPIPCPLITLVGASNELPDGDDLQALDDRFLLRYWVEYLPPNKLTTLLTSVRDQKRKEITEALTLVELNDLQAQARALPITDSAIASLSKLSMELAGEGIVVSDRTWVKCLGLLQAYALLEGAEEVDEDSFDILAHVLWKRPDDRKTVARAVKKVGNVLQLKADELLQMVKDATDPLVSTERTADSRWAAQVAATMPQIKEMAAELARLIEERQGQNRRVKPSVLRALETIEKIQGDLMDGISALWSQPAEAK